MHDKDSWRKAFAWTMGTLLTCALLLREVVEIIQEVLEMLG